MVPIMSLVIPIVVSAVLVFVASSIIHMVLGYHRSDYRKLPKEDEVQDSLRGFNIPPGDYILPCPGSASAMKEPAFVEKYKKGPIVFMTVIPGGPPTMGKQLVLWFLYTVVVGILSAYVAGRALGPGAPYLEVFRFAGCAAFLSYAMALPQYSIWYKRNVGTTLRSMFDGLIYGLLTGGTFGWLWPR
ncbi:MAG: hypothetical protein HYZ58_12570 [Acidobacteria bacterium]|nr:hypothetical protein [Acidobacteriota bacterium]MBI3263965.1 hypothetical protein [Acidobacteriota bacterium]